MVYILLFSLNILKVNELFIGRSFFYCIYNFFFLKIVFFYGCKYVIWYCFLVKFNVIYMNLYLILVIKKILYKYVLSFFFYNKFV